VFNVKDPDVPALAVPVLTCTDPLTPADPAFAVSTTKLPLDVFVPRPVITLNIPPDAASVVSPAATDISPPTPVFPDPTFITKLPAFPLTASPVVNENDPLSPPVDAPVLNLNPPLTPFDPAFGVVNVNAPDDVDSEYPVLISMFPPFPVAAKPAFTVILPPLSDVSLPLV
jgi:hypothetical protein